MGLFKMSHSKPAPTPEALLIPEFRALWARDGKRHKTIAVEDLAYVYFMMDWQSPYRAYPLEERTKEIKKDVILTRPRWKEDDEVKAAMVKYDELQMTPTLRYLKAVEGAVEKSMRYFHDVNFDPDKKTEDGEKVSITDISKMIKAASESPKLLDSLQKLTDKVRKEQGLDENIRGGGEAGPYEG